MSSFGLLYWELALTPVGRRVEASETTEHRGAREAGSARIVPVEQITHHVELPDVLHWSDRRSRRDGAG